MSKIVDTNKSRLNKKITSVRAIMTSKPTQNESGHKTHAFAQKPFYKNDPVTTILLTLGIFLLSQIVALLLVSMYPAILNWTEQESRVWLENSVTAQFIYILLAESIAIYMVLRFVRWAKVLPARIGLVKPRMKDIVYAVATYGLYFVTYVVILTIAGILIPNLNVDQEQQIGFGTAFSNLELLMTFASLVILPPLAEEIIFRGFLFTSLRSKFRLRHATIITSFIFGLSHLQFGSGAPLLWVAAIDTFVLSCFLCLIREQTKSLWPAIYLHAVKNGVAFTVLFGSRFIPF